MKYLSVFSFIILLIIACDRQNEYDYPVIITGEVTDIDNTGAVFHAKITEYGATEILKCGFVWSVKETPDTSSSKIVLTGVPKTGPLSVKVSFDLKSDTTYFVRAFVYNNKYITYGKTVTFKSKGGLRPIITDFNPKEGSNNTQITIIGSNFSNSLTGNKVRFGHASATIIEATSEKLIVVLPDNLTISGNVFIYIETLGSIARSDSEFRLAGCNILNFSPERLAGGDMIMIKAEDFNMALTSNLLKIEDQTAELFKISHDTIFAYIPYNVISGKNEISLSVGGKTCFANDSLLIRAPWKAVSSNLSFGNGAYSSFTIGNYAYLVIDNQLWKFRSGEFIWSRCADLPGEFRSYTTGFAVGGKGYVCFGAEQGLYRYVYEYDPAEDIWSRKNDFPGQGRIHAIAFVASGRAYVGTGEGLGPTMLRDFWEYDPAADTWNSRKEYPSTWSNEVAGFSSGNKIYAGLGTNEHVYPSSNEFWEYDTSTDNWKKLADFPGIARLSPATFVIENFGYAGTGWINTNWGTILNDFWRYEIKNNKWIRIPDIPFGPRNRSVSYVFDNKAYVCEGSIHRSEYDRI